MPSPPAASRARETVSAASPGTPGTSQTRESFGEPEPCGCDDKPPGGGLKDQIMNTRISVTDFVRVTKKNLAVCAAFPLVAVLVLLFGFVCDEALGLGDSSMIHAIYSAGNWLYCFVLLPLTFFDIDSSSPMVFKIALVLMPIWWYLLACVLTLLADRKVRMGRG